MSWRKAGRELNALADALIEAVLFIAHREYTEDSPIEEYEDEDIEELETLKTLLASATEPEKQALEDSLQRAIAKLPPGSELAPFYRAWMQNMFSVEDEEPDAPQIEIQA
jgi:hypothetical protein